MTQYRTEAFIPPDRSICLLLPSHLPAGWATITVQIQEPEPMHAGTAWEDELDRQDIEWWEEFEDDCECVGW